MSHDTLESVLASLVPGDGDWLVGSILVPMLGRDSQLNVWTPTGSLDEYAYRCLEDCLGLPSTTVRTTGRAMLSMHEYLADYCGDLEVSLNSVDEIWEHTGPWYVIVPEDRVEGCRHLRFHFQADWETHHGVEVIVRDGTEVVFVGNCGTAGSLENVESGRCSENFLERVE